jgi:hypothetical protein
MALRNQPYIPLYVQDFITDEKLIECSALATGVYIRIMCAMHKSEQYGIILLKQKYKQTTSTHKNFALQLAKQLPYDVATIETGLIELLSEKVIYIDGDSLIQKRMVKDNQVSEQRALAGGLGGKKTQSKLKKIKNDFALAKNEANTEYENTNANANENTNAVCMEGEKVSSDIPVISSELDKEFTQHLIETELKEQQNFYKQ